MVTRNGYQNEVLYLNHLNALPPELEPVSCLETILTQEQVDPIKSDLIKLERIFQEESQKLPKALYDSHNCRMFYRDVRDIRLILRQIETELKHPRDQQMQDFSHAALWLYGEQILLLREIGELNAAVSRRNHPQARGTETRTKYLSEGLAGTG